MKTIPDPVLIEKISRTLAPGVQLQDVESKDTWTIHIRKEDDSGWWLTDGGFADWVLDGYLHKGVIIVIDHWNTFP